MSMEIKADRLRMYKIREINMLSQVDLPSEYLARPPHCYKSRVGNGLVLKYIDLATNTISTTVINIGDELTEHCIALVEEMIEASGQRLHNINHKNDKKETENEHKESVEWAGTYIFEV